MIPYLKPIDRVNGMDTIDTIDIMRNNLGIGFPKQQENNIICYINKYLIDIVLYVQAKKRARKNRSGA